MINESEGHCPTAVASFSFLSAGKGFVEQADGSILLTTNGGETLQPKTPVPLNGTTASKLEFISPTTGFAVTAGAGGRIFRTTDGANSWTQVASSPAALSDLTFVTPTTAYAVGAHGTLLASTDAGGTWTALALALPAGTPPLALTHISCSAVKQCLIATAPAPGANTNVLVRTTDGGLTRMAGLAVRTESAGGVLLDLRQRGRRRPRGATVLSSDGGATFSTLVSRSLGSLYARRIRIGQSALDAYALGNTSQIAATTNGGESWSLLRVPRGAALRRRVSEHPSRLRRRRRRRVFRTADGGLSWSILSSGGGSPSALLAPGVNTLLLTGPRGVRRSTDAGASFASVKPRL